MKRASRKQLSLNMQTVRPLTATELGNAAGGLGKTDQAGACSYTDRTCQTAYCDTYVSSYCATSEYCP